MNSQQKPGTQGAHLWVTLSLLLAFLTLEVMTAPNFLVATDLWFENLLLTVRTPFLLSVFDEITFLGNSFVVMGIAGIVGLFLWYSKVYRAYVMGLVVTLLSAATTGYAMKVLVGRARPSGLIPSLSETSFSFPSGHATAAMALYGFLAYLLCRLFPTKKPTVITAATLLIGSIGFSRLYLGVHFPSDILAGYILGGICLLIGISVAEDLEHKGVVRL